MKNPHKLGLSTALTISHSYLHSPYISLYIGLNEEGIEFFGEMKRTHLPLLWLCPKSLMLNFLRYGKKMILLKDLLTVEYE